MKIGVIGYYGYGNAGDEAILENITKALAPHRVVGFPVDFPFAERMTTRLNAYDFLVLGGGGLYNRSAPGPFGSFDIWEKQLTTPIGVLGLGVEVLDQTSLPAVHALVERSEFFVVRDEESKRLIGHPKVQVAPDLTFYDPPRLAPHEASSIAVCGVNLRPFGKGAEAWLEAVQQLDCEKRAVPLSTVPTFDDRELLVQLDPNCPPEFDRACYSKFDILVGTAFHSIVFAIQAGIPVVAICYHPKVQRLMDEVGLSEYALHWDEHHRLSELFARALANRSAIRQQMLAYTENAQRQLQRLFHGIVGAIEGSGIRSTAQASVTPRVSVLIDCRGAANEAVQLTVASCCMQSLPNQVILLADDDTPQLDQSSYGNADGAIQVISLYDVQDSKSVTKAIGGQYIVWLPAGYELAYDALYVLAETLDADPDAIMSYSDCYITEKRKILSKLSLRASRTPRQLAATCCVFLVRRSWTAIYSANKSLDRIASVLKKHRSSHVPFGLVYKPATQAELHCIRSAVAFGRGQITEARDLLASASQLDSQLLAAKEHQERFFGFFLECAFSRSIGNDPVQYFETTIENFPRTTPILRKAANAFTARASLEEAYIWYGRGDMEQARKSFMRCIRRDPRWLLDRGVLSFGLNRLR